MTSRTYATKYALPGSVVIAMFRCGIYANEALRPSWAAGQVRGELLDVMATFTGPARPWNGTPEDLKKTTTRLSVRFAKLFECPGVDNFTEHDLRHEATCRWVEMRIPRSGSCVFGDIEICRIMGWTDTNMMLRPACAVRIWLRD